jgi:hypothetical protein
MKELEKWGFLAGLLLTIVIPIAAFQFGWKFGLLATVICWTIHARDRTTI